ncbi:uncharacterized protein PAC_07798 [Phialocephala subalpina]|uniref:Uncharacterized protein n=1 Tax=Phialocephala subalpina TaxID=576137 RepID=A0A1L7WYQ9_9HELO|nr:uncharacterized protein PAC_07798 [Phialocephala subalpina]
MSGSNPSIHTHPSYAMETRIQGNAFKGQIVLPPIPTTNVPNTLNREALLALPLIGIWVGVDELAPSKNVFAIYDPGNCGLRYTHGDGTMIPPEQVLFSNKYKDPSAINNRSQRVHFLALNTASMNHYEMINRDSYTRENLQIRYPTTDSVKKALTYHVDAPSNHDGCQALQDLEENDDTSFDYVSSAIEISSGPLWDFNPTSFQAYSPQNQAKTFEALYKDFQKSYQSSLDLMGFQHATFCLAGLVKANMVPFVLEGQHDPRVFSAGQISAFLPKRQLPLRTTKGWTVDCFIARWDIFRKIFDPRKFIRYPNPILWLEAELDVEEMLSTRDIGFQFTKPWKGKVYNVNVRSVLDWDILKSLRWQTRGDSNRYPKPCQSSDPQRSQPNSLASQPASWPSQPPRMIPGDTSTIEKPRRRKERQHHDPNESKFDRRVREEKEKLRKRTDKIKQYEYPDYQPTSDGLSYQGPVHPQSDNSRRVRGSQKPRSLYEIPEYKGPTASSSIDQSDLYQMEEGQPLADMTQLYYGTEDMGHAGPSNRKRPYGNASYERRDEMFQQPEYQNDDSYGIYEDVFDEGHSRKKSRSRRHSHKESSHRKSKLPTIDNLFASPRQNMQRMRTSEMLTLKKEKAQFESDYTYDGDFAGPFAGEFDEAMETGSDFYGSSSRSGFYPTVGPQFVQKPIGHARAFEEACDTFEREHRIDPSDPRHLSTLQSPSIESPEMQNSQFVPPPYASVRVADMALSPSIEHGHERAPVPSRWLVASIEQDDDSASNSAMQLHPSIEQDSVLPLLSSIEARNEENDHNKPNNAVMRTDFFVEDDEDDSIHEAAAEEVITIHFDASQSAGLPAVKLASPISFANGPAAANAREPRSMGFYREGPQRRLRVFERYSDTASMDNGPSMGGAGQSFRRTVPNNRFTTTSSASELHSGQTVPNDSLTTASSTNGKAYIPIEMITSASGVADLFSSEPVGRSERRPSKSSRRYSNSRAHPVLIDDSPSPPRTRRSRRSSKPTKQRAEAPYTNSFDLFGESSSFHPGPSMSGDVRAVNVDYAEAVMSFAPSEEPRPSQALSQGAVDDLEDIENQPPEPKQEESATPVAEERVREVTPYPEAALEELHGEKSASLSPEEVEEHGHVPSPIPDAEATQALMEITLDVD